MRALFLCIILAVCFLVPAASNAFVYPPPGWLVNVDWNDVSIPYMTTSGTVTLNTYVGLKWNAASPSLSNDTTLFGGTGGGRFYEYNYTKKFFNMVMDNQVNTFDFLVNNALPAVITDVNNASKASFNNISSKIQAVKQSQDSQTAKIDAIVTKLGITTDSGGEPVGNWPLFYGLAGLAVGTLFWMIVIR